MAAATEHSHYLSRLYHADPALAAYVTAEAHRPFSREHMTQGFASLPCDTEEALKRNLRKLRQRMMAHLITRDVGRLATLDEVLTTISDFAEFCVETALAAVKPFLAHYGDPIGEETQTVQELIVVGMGKLGGGELNVSSDIDLIFIYEEEGETNGTRRISNHEYFTLLGKKLIAALSEPTGDGFVFRVDMRLRPYGDSGPLVMSLAALENYLLSQGREWERYAWIKGKALTGNAEALAAEVRPFVYRKYLDFNAYGAMRELYAQIQREVARRELIDNIKLGAGGIREVEFIAQVFQLIRGGREKRLQLRSTRHALTLLAEMKLLEEDTVSELQAAYAFLRDVEHRLQYLDDQQTQTLPTGEESRARIARSMGFADWDSFLVGLNQHRNQVNRHFQQVFLLPTDQHASHPLSALWQEVSHAPEAAEPALAELGYHDPAAVARQLASLARSQRYQQLPATNRKRFDALIPPLVEVSASFANPDETLSRILGLLEAISRRAPYLALLTEYPQTLRRLATLYAASPWVATYLTKHPILLDELLDARVLYAEPDWTVLAAQLEQQLADCGQDVEGKMDVLRHFQHAQQFRLVAQDLAGMWPLEALSDQLSLLADTVLAATLRHAWLDVAKRHLDTPRFAIIGYGKLGGKELGYGSDLDLIFLYDDPHPDAPDLYARLVRKLSTWLTSATSAGILYDVDLRLRPNGQSGLLVSSVEAFLSYQRKSAWLWEHQALTRARFVAGDSAVGDAFEKIRFDILSQPRDLAALRTEVLAMRARMRESHPAHPSKPKHAHGGIVDLEFIVQYWVLAYSHLHPELTGNIGNIALLKLAANAGLLDHDHAEACQAAYRYYRRVQHAERLNEHGTGEADAALSAHYAQVSALWTAVLGGEG